MNRRGFLTSVLALAAAPAIVRAENLMKICVPSQEISLINRAIWSPLYTTDTIENGIIMADCVEEIRITRGIARYTGSFKTPIGVLQQY